MEDLQLSQRDAQMIQDPFYSQGDWAEFGATLEPAIAAAAVEQMKEAHDSDELSDEEVFLFGAAKFKQQQQQQQQQKPQRKFDASRSRPTRKQAQKNERAERRWNDMLIATKLAIEASEAPTVSAPPESWTAHSAQPAPSNEPAAEKTETAAVPVQEDEEEKEELEEPSSAQTLPAPVPPEHARALFAEFMSIPITADFSLRESQLQQALNLSLAQRNNKMIIAANAALGQAYIDRQLYRYAIAYLNSAISVGRKDPSFPPAAMSTLERLLAKAYFEVGDSRNAAFALHRPLLPSALTAMVDAAVLGGLESTQALQELVDAYLGGPFEHCLDRAHPVTGVTPLHVASAKGDVALVQSLLACPAVNKAAKDNQGMSALFWAARFNAEDDVVRHLLKAGLRLDDEETASMDEGVKQVVVGRIDKLK